MFCAKTSPCPVALTDFGEIWPRMVAASDSRSVSEWGSGLLVLAAGDAGVAFVAFVGEIACPAVLCDPMDPLGVAVGLLVCGDADVAG